MCNNLPGFSSPARSLATKAQCTKWVLAEVINYSWPTCQSATGNMFPHVHDVCGTCLGMRSHIQISSSRGQYAMKIVVCCFDTSCKQC